MGGVRESEGDGVGGPVGGGGMARKEVGGKKVEVVVKELGVVRPGRGSIKG